MNKSYIGIDLGTSSVKVIQKFENGDTKKAKAVYSEITPDGFYDAVVKALKQLDLSSVCAVGFSSQVGTYIVNGNDVISWNAPIGAVELKEIKDEYLNEKFISEISMPHPEIISYPIPRLKYIQKKYGDGATVCQPKDYIINRFCGKNVTDKFSWRGLANIKNGEYSELFLKETGNPVLPEIVDITDCAGLASPGVCKNTGLPEKTPLYIGMNDYFSSLLGMGIFDIENAFDITGTSEHFGVITDSVSEKTNMVSGPYIENFVHYGVTASSGCSLQFGLDNFNMAELDEADSEIVKTAPIFTPYLKGERAPVFDSNAKGAFVGITDKCSEKHMAYSVLEGVAFSIYHIYKSLGSPAVKNITVSGGASENKLLNTLKATLFNVPLIVPEETDTSALGAVVTAVSGFEKNSNIKEIAEKLNKTKSKVLPDGNIRDLLLKRFEIYKRIYPSLKELNKSFEEVLK